MPKNGCNQIPSGSNGHTTEAGQYFEQLARTVQAVPVPKVQEIADELLRAYAEDRHIFLFGNGGSAALASHFACDLGKGTTCGLSLSKRFRVSALTDNIPLMTAWSNDSSYEDIFSEQMQGLVSTGDIAFAISGSGNSPNVLKALRTARRAGAVCLGLTGFEGGKMRPLCDICLVVPSDSMQIIEDLHLSVAHAVFTSIRHQLASENNLVERGLVKH
jgi:D-sedoheptulose 7-phosphate isomerase